MVLINDMFPQNVELSPAPHQWLRTEAEGSCAIPGFGCGYYWYGDGCYAWTDYGYVELCYPYDYPG
jgi:hypothetical protein